jgi:HD-like signal output (HDOD) protein
MADIAAFFNTVKLPTMPEVAHRLIRTLNEDDPPVIVVRDAISQDPALTAKLLRLANSARFGLPRQVVSVDDAIALAGMNHVRTLALSACLSEAFPTVQGLSRDEFWQESLSCAAYAGWLAQHVGSDAQEAWLAGFMLRLGELLIAQSAPQSLAEIERLPHIPGGRWEREQRLTGFSEGQITAELARRWNFPDSLVQGLERCADPMATRPFCRLSGILHVAELLAEMAYLGEPAEAMVQKLPEDILRALQLDIGWLRAHMPEPQSLAGSVALH